MKIQKLDPQDVYSKIDVISISAMAGKIDELVDVINELQTKVNKLAPTIDFAQPKVKENVRPDYVATTYMTDGHTKEYYGQNGATVVTDNPIPAGYLITIREPETKGGDNE